MLIGAYAAGIARCIILADAGSGAAERLGNALAHMRAYTLLGSNILDSRFGSEIEVREMPLSLASGYRIELFRCLEEGLSLPHVIPALPAASELAGKPALIINPETASILSAFHLRGPEESVDSKVLSLSGSVVHRRTVEVPVNMSVRTAIERLGGGVPGGKAMKAVQLGGLAGPFIDPGLLDLTIGSDAVEELCSGIGMGNIEVLDADSRIPDATKEIMAAIQSQSCGKCVFCREGCLQLLTILEDILENKRQPQDLDLLVELSEEMKTACLCDFGRTAPNPVLSGLKLFRGEYEK
jgi:NADH:ubiquinone oxidoreductase subunit F (NADH-binding)